MVSRKVLAAYGALAALVWMLTYGAVHATFEYVRGERAKVHAVETRTYNVPLPPRADPYRVELTVPAGELAVGSTSDVLLQAEHSYNHADLYSELQLDEEARVVRLIPPAVEVDQYDLATLFAFDDLVNRWHINLSDAIPLELDVEMGLGSARLDLSHLQVAAFNLDAGVGEVSLDLTGPRPFELRAKISGGIGAIDVALPADVGVEVTANHGIGEVVAEGLVQHEDRYVNAAFDRGPVRIYLSLDVGVGDVSLYVVE